MVLIIKSLKDQVMDDDKLSRRSDMIRSRERIHSSQVVEARVTKFSGKV